MTQETATTTLTKAGDYEAWFKEALAACERAPDDASADDELGQLNQQLHESEEEILAVIGGGADGACLHIFRDGSVLCCHCLRQLTEMELLNLSVCHQSGGSR